MLFVTQKVGAAPYLNGIKVLKWLFKRENEKSSLKIAAIDL